MRYFLLVGVFALCLVLKVSTAAAAESTTTEEGAVKIGDEIVAGDIVTTETATVTEKTVEVAEPIAKTVEVAEPIAKTVEVAEPIAKTVEVAEPIALTSPGTQVAYYNASAGDADVVSVMGVSSHHRGGAVGLVSIQPMAGVAVYHGYWRHVVSNRYSTGLALEIGLSPFVALEIEGGHGKYSAAYLSPVGPVMHDFQQYSLGSNLKAYFARGRLSPYVGAGLMGLRYEGMLRGYQPCDMWIGAGELMAGMDLHLAPAVALGIRAAWVAPLIGRPALEPGFEEATLMNTSFYRFMGAIKVTL